MAGTSRQQVFSTAISQRPTAAVTLQFIIRQYPLMPDTPLAVFFFLDDEFDAAGIDTAVTAFDGFYRLKHDTFRGFGEDIQPFITDFLSSLFSNSCWHCLHQSLSSDHFETGLL